jgi:PrpF protein
MLVAVSPLMSSIVQELGLKVAHLIGLNQYTLETMRQAALPFAVSVAAAKDYVGMDGVTVRAQDIDLVARFYIESIMHTAAPGTGSCCLGAAATIPGTVPNRLLTGRGPQGRKGRQRARCRSTSIPWEEAQPLRASRKPAAPSVWPDPRCTEQDKNCGTRLLRVNHGLHHALRGVRTALTVAEEGSVALSQRREKPMTGQPDSPAGLSFERDVRPMLREKDRDSMLKAFDLWSHSDVQAHQDAILERLRNGTMPCDGVWPPEHVAVFQRWIASGSAP